MVRNNIEGARLQIILRHSDFKTTLRYLSLPQKGHSPGGPRRRQPLQLSGETERR